MAATPGTHRQQASRREFLTQAVGVSAALVAVPDIVRASALGLGGHVPPSDRIVMAAIGTGGKGRHNTGEFLKFPDVQFVAVCDVDTEHSAEDKKQIDAFYQNNDCRVYGDLRELLAKEKLNAVHVSTPDHWHALASIAAMQAGCDVYCEKPLANSVAESIAIRNTAKKLNRIVQTGSHERSNPKVRLAAELARSGALGKITSIDINMPCRDEWHHKQVLEFQGIPQPMPVPPQLNWDLWLGHTPVVPYHEKRAHFWWRFILAYGGGEMSDRGAHILDLAQLVLDQDESGPVRFEAKGTRNPKNLYDVFMDYTFDCTYANGVKLHGVNQEPRGLRINGSDGWIFVHIHGGELEASAPEILEAKSKTMDLGRSPGHHRNFIDCVQSRQQPFAHAGIGCRTATLCHLNNIAMLVERPLTWDPQAEKIVNDPEASQLLLPSMRQPWHL